MAHFAQIDGSNTVLRVLVVADDQEHRGQDFLAEDLGLGGTWIQCSYHGTVRKQFPGVGYSYDPIADVFVAPRPYPSWTLDANHDWQPPVPMPPGLSQWDEAAQEWL